MLKQDLFKINITCDGILVSILFIIDIPSVMKEFDDEICGYVMWFMAIGIRNL